MDGYRYFGIEPPFAYGARADSRAARFPDSVERASKVIGAAVRNETDEKLGRVDNLMVDIQAGRIVHVVVSSGGFLGVGDELRAIPPSVCRYRETDNLVIVNASKDVVLHAPQLKAGEWTNLNDAAYSARVYRAYQVEPYFTLDADPARRQVRDRDVRAITPQERSLTPLDQGNSEEDIDLTRRIRKEIMELPDLSVNARNIKIITANGRVTLRGPVSSAAEKRTLEVLARRIASPEQVESQLEIKEPADR